MIFGVELDGTLGFEKWEWGQLLDPGGFKWDPVSTPFANPNFVVLVWLIYWTVVFGLGKVMQHREPFALPGIPGIHNLFLASWSAAMFLGLAVAMVAQHRQFGVRALFCAESEAQVDPMMQYCLYIFYLSKFYELFDTVILRLKKKKLIFLHWYHHSIVLAMTWSWLHWRIAFACGGMLANTLVHVFMYYYYYVTSFPGVQVWWKKYITTMQLVQFATSFVLTVVFRWYSYDGRECIGSHFGPFEFTLAANVSFFVLFSQFYDSNYKGRKGNQGDREGKKSS